ncbi:hypothetical protein BDW62DRAFT_206072 [Aspergillus aurantiobrunneus]
MLLRCATSLAVLQMAALGLAVPFADTQLEKRSDVPWQHSQTYKNYDWNDLCNEYDPILKGDPDVARTLWKELGVGAWFDAWLGNHNNKMYWPNRMDWEVHGNGRTQYAECHDITDTSCNPPDDCKWYVDQGMGPAFWVLQSVATLHDGLLTVHEGLQDGTINSSLRIDDMISKFGLGEDTSGDINVMSVLSAAFTMAAGAAVGAPPLAGPLTVIAGAFSMASVFGTSTTPDPTAAVNVQLADAFVAAQEAIVETTKVIFGGPNDDSTEDLPMQVGDYHDAMARFFAEGKFLGLDMSSSLTEITKEWSRRHSQALAAWFIGHMGYIVTVATNQGSREDCEAMNMWSTYFHEPTSRCFNVMKYNEGGWGTMPLKMDDGPMSVAMNDYGVDKDEFYNNAYACAEAFPDGGGKVSSDYSTIPKDGSLPTCFFNVPLVEGWIKPAGTGWAWLKDTGLNSAHAKGNRLG